MKSFLGLVLFELKMRLKSFNILSFAFITFVSAVLFGLGSVGAIGSVQIQFGVSSRLAMNSPVALHLMTCILGMMIFFVNAYPFGEGIDKDYETKFHQIIFTKPISKELYLLWKYCSGMILALFFALLIPFTLYLTSHLPIINELFLIDNKVLYYLYPVLVILLPNTLFGAGLVLLIITKTKRLAPVNLGLLFVFISMPLLSILASNLDLSETLAYFDPFALHASTHAIRYWSVAQQTTELIPLEGPLLINRLIWSSLGVAMFLISLKRFTILEGDQKTLKIEPSVLPKKRFLAKNGLQFFQVTPNSLRTLIALSKFELKQITKNKQFLLVLLTSVFVTLTSLSNLDELFSMPSWPLTSVLINHIAPLFTFFMMIITASFAGEIVWRDKERKLHEVVAVKPLSNFTFFLSKLLALCGLQLLLFTGLMALLIAYQAYNSYFNFELSLYLRTFYFYMFVPLILFNILALFIQIISPNKNLGAVIIFAFWWATSQLPTIGLDHILYRFGHIPVGPYTDLNGYANSLYPFTVMALYWGCLYLLLAKASIIIWPRELALSKRERLLKLSWSRITRKEKTLSVVLGSCFILLGAHIFYNTNTLNYYQSPKQKNRAQALYELNYKAFQYRPIPTHHHLSIEMAFDPHNRQIVAESQIVYRNNNSLPVDEFLMRFKQGVIVHELKWSRPVEKLKYDPKTRFHLMRLNPPLMPGEELIMDIHSEAIYRGFQNTGIFTTLNAKYSYFGVDEFLPTFGYSSILEMTEEAQRIKEGLPKDVTLAPANNQRALYETYLPGVSSWATAEIKISLPETHQAFFPGKLIKNVSQKGFNHFTYKTERKTLPFFTMATGDYEVLKDSWNSIDLEIHYYHSHDWNIDRMMEGMKHSLELFTQEFSPYQFDSLTLVEIPNYSRFAQALPGLISFSEGIGFTTRVDLEDEEAIDFPYYIVAHEVAHMWWAHQVIGADVEGATMLSESLAQYSAYLVMEERYGRHMMRRFLRHELHGYLNARSRTSRKEFPLAYTDNSPFIHYQKGGLVFYALSYFLGKDRVNQVLREFINRYAFQGPPFATSIELVEDLIKAAPEDYQQMVRDLFYQITLYDMHTENILVRQENDLSYTAIIKGKVEKFYADEWGNELKAPLNDHIPVLLFDEDGKIVYDKPHLITDRDVHIELNLDEKPYSGGIDPLNILIDKSPRRNSVDVDFEQGLINQQMDNHD